MLRRIFATLTFTIIAVSLKAAPETPPAAAKLSAAEIANKNVAARGGLEAWRAVQTISMQGKLGAGGNQRATLAAPMANMPSKKSVDQIVRPRPVAEAQLPFVMELKRPRRMRLELQFNGQTAIQAFDGTNGWKLRPFLNRREVEPYTSDEIKIASTQSELDGFLVDYAAKGTQIDLDGIEKVEDRDAYKLKLTLKSGQVTHVWVDTQTFLETKIEGAPRRLDGTYHPVEVYYRDYRAVSGLLIPFVLETRVLPVTKTALGLKDTPVPAEKIIIDKVTVNLKLDDSLFLKPDLGAALKSK
jgi:hypothetical protein